MCISRYRSYRLGNRQHPWKGCAIQTALGRRLSLLLTSLLRPDLLVSVLRFCLHRSSAVMSYNEKSVADQQPQLPVPANAPPPVPNVDTIQVTGVTQHEIGSEKASEPPSYSHSTDDSYGSNDMVYGRHTNARRDMTLQTGRPNTIDKSGVYETPSDPRTLNHVLSLKDLREEPDFVDCPHCKSRQKTRVTHPDSSATT